MMLFTLKTDNVIIVTTPNQAYNGIVTHRRVDGTNANPASLGTQAPYAHRGHPSGGFGETSRPTGHGGRLLRRPGDRYRDILSVDPPARYPG